MRRDHHNPLARISLGLGIEGSAVVLQQLDTVPANCDRPRRKVNIGQAQAQYFIRGAGRTSRRAGPQPGTWE